MKAKYTRASSPEGAALAPFDPESRVALEWRQPKAFTSRFELTDGRNVFARVVKTGFWSEQITVEFAHARWAVRPTAFGDLVVDGPEGRKGPHAMRHRSGFFTGKLERAGLPTLRTHSGGFWHPWWELRDEEDQPLLHLDMECGFSRTESKLVVFDAARRLPDLPLLAAMTLLAMLAAQRHSSHAAGAGSGA